MLGRLRMSLKECEAAYIQLSKEIFTPVRDLADPRRVYDFFKANGKFDEKPLESCIKEAVKRNGLDEDALLEEVGSELEPCKVYVAHFYIIPYLRRLTIRKALCVQLEVKTVLRR